MTYSDSEKIGRLLEAVEQLREDFKEERASARESRSNMHRRLDEQAEDIARLRTDMQVAGKVEAQVRDRLYELEKTVEQNHNSIQPDIEYWRRTRRLGMSLFYLLGVGGISLGAMLAYAGETLKHIILRWLGLDH